MPIDIYDFPSNPASSGYCIFPETLEKDDMVVFHATPFSNYDAIVRNGFKIPDPQGASGLPSVSFGKSSFVALHHAITMRASLPGDYCIFAVRYNSLNRGGLVDNITDIHDYTLDPPPEIIGYSIVPENYEHR